MATDCELLMMRGALVTMHKCVILLSLLAVVLLAVNCIVSPSDAVTLLDKDIMSVFRILTSFFVGYLAISAWRVASRLWGMSVVGSIRFCMFVDTVVVPMVLLIVWILMLGARVFLGRIMGVEPITRITQGYYVLTALYVVLFWVAAWHTMCCTDGDIVAYFRRWKRNG